MLTGAFVDLMYTTFLGEPFKVTREQIWSDLKQSTCCLLKSPEAGEGKTHATLDLGTPSSFSSFRNDSDDCEANQCSQTTNNDINYIMHLAFKAVYGIQERANGAKQSNMNFVNVMLENWILRSSICQAPGKKS